MTICVICGDLVLDYRPTYCCRSRACGCKGEPLYPCVCEDEKCIEEARGRFPEFDDLFGEV